MIVLSALLFLALAGHAAYWGWDVYRHGHLGFHYEKWRAPFHALHAVANDPDWLVSEGDPGALGNRPGMFGPVIFTVHGTRIGAYIRDGDRFDEVIDRTKIAIRRSRQQKVRLHA